VFCLLLKSQDMGEEQPPGNIHIFVQKHLQERYRYKTKKQCLSVRL